MKRIVALLIAVAALVAAGCGSSNNSSGSSSGGSSSSSSTQSTSSSSPASSGGGGKTVAIGMQNIKFSPTSQTVKVGQKVVWTNKDSVDHNVTATSGGSFKSKNFGQGGTFSFTPTKPGTIKYVCTIHPGMDGTLTVVK
jgi:plastocyanin